MCGLCRAFNLLLSGVSVPAMAPPGQVGLNRPAFGTVQLQRPGEGCSSCSLLVP
jgi:hypothetical protein